MKKLTTKYVISPIDNKKYCRINGRFLIHLRTNGYNTYQEFFDEFFPEKIKFCECGAKSSFNNTTMVYLRSCGKPKCVGNIISDVKSKFSDEKYALQKLAYQKTMSLKTPEELKAFRDKAVANGKKNGSFKKSVKFREETCETLYGDPKYNNPRQISQTKLSWSEDRKNLFLKRLKASLGGKWMSDFLTKEIFTKRRKFMEEQGDWVPLEKLSDWQRYSRNVRNLTKKIYNENKNIINPKNLSRKRGEYELDHIIPVYYGFMNNIPVDLMASVDNLQMLTMMENRQKRCKYELCD